MWDAHEAALLEVTRPLKAEAKEISENLERIGGAGVALWTP